jgi:hypothetical protein
MSDLALEDTSALVKELFRRCDAAVLTLYRDLNEKRYDVSTFTKGSSIEVLGLIQFANDHVERTIFDTEADE